MAKGKRKKWEKRGEKTGKSTFWPGHAPWATASSGVPAGPAEIEFGSGHAWQASRQAGRRRASNMKLKKREKPFFKFNYEYFSAMLFVPM